MSRWAQSQPFSASDPACRVQSIQKSSTTYENAATNFATHLTAVTRLDSRGVYQVYVAKQGAGNFTCISCAPRPGAPRVDRNKPMISWNPSGKWLVVGVEENSHDLRWIPYSWQRGLLQSGVWLNMWVTKPDGSAWSQLTDFKPSAGPANGFVGVPFTPDGKTGVWAEIVNGNIFANKLGVWKLYRADFHIPANDLPALANRRDITPAGARWVEPGDFSPDGRYLLLSADIGMRDAEGQDQFVLDTATGSIQNLTNSPTVWDEHGIYSPDGKKIVFMSSYPYRNDPKSHKTASLKTEFMLMSADGSHLQQLTHFNMPGYPESQKGHTVAAVAAFNPQGSQLLGAVMAPNFTKTNWIIHFAGPCGNERGN